MSKAIGVLAFGLIFLFSSTAAEAAPTTIAGQVSGIELCPQFICGAAYFAGGFHGQIGFNPNAKGVIVTALRHGELPTVVGASTPIHGGVWELRTLLRRFAGVVTEGEITYIGNDTFRVTASLVLITANGLEALTFDGFLDHNTPIPTFGGVLQTL